MGTQLEELIAQLKREPGKQAFQGLCIFPSGRARAIYRWGAINFRSTAELQDYYEHNKQRTEVSTAAGVRTEQDSKEADSLVSVDPS